MGGRRSAWSVSSSVVCCRGSPECVSVSVSVCCVLCVQISRHDLCSAFGGAVPDMFSRQSHSALLPCYCGCCQLPPDATPQSLSLFFPGITTTTKHASASLLHYILVLVLVHSSHLQYCLTTLFFLFVFIF